MIEPQSQASWCGAAALHAAARSCARRKRARPDAVAFRLREGEELIALAERLAAGTYRPEPGRVFVTQRPKYREVQAAAYRDRVVHHLLHGLLEPLLEPRFSDASFACRKGKGTHAAAMRLQDWMWRLSRHGGVRVYALQLDVVNFFMSIHKPTLLKLLEPRLREAEAAAAGDKPPPYISSTNASTGGCGLGCLATPSRPPYISSTSALIGRAFVSRDSTGVSVGNVGRGLVPRRPEAPGGDPANAFGPRELCRRIVFHDTAGARQVGSPALFSRVPPHKRSGALGPDRGLPIGNLTSQLFGNVYLSPLDHFVQRRRPASPADGRRPKAGASDRTLGLRGYVRYVDDFVLLHPDRAVLEAARDRIVTFLRERLRLEVRAQPVVPASAGVNFVGYVVRPRYLLPRRRVVQSFSERLGALDRKLSPAVARPGVRLSVPGIRGVRGPVRVTSGLL